MTFLNKKIISLLIIVIYIFTINSVKAQNTTYYSSGSSYDPSTGLETTWTSTRTEDENASSNTSLNTNGNPDFIDWVDGNELRVNDNEVAYILNTLLSTTKNLYRETLRNNFWYMDKLGIKAEKDQGLEKAKIQTLTNELDQEFIDWVNYGFNEGNPAYIADSTNFFKRLRERVTKDFVKTLDKLFPEGTSDTPDFMEDIKMILLRGEDVEINYDDEIKSTIMSWDEFKDLEAYQNPTMIYNSLKSRLDTLIQENNSNYNAELLAGNGFLSFKKCDVSYTDNSDNVSQSDKGVITFYGDINYYDGDLWAKGGGKAPVVKCVVITPGAVIYDKLSSINTAKDQILRMNAALTNGKDSLLSGIKEELETSQTDILKYGLLSTNSTDKKIDTKKLNEKIKENSVILAESTGGNMKIENDLSNPRNVDSPYYPGNFLTDDEWEKIWGTGETITDAPEWYDKENYLFGKDWDKWEMLDVFKKQNSIKK